MGNEFTLWNLHEAIYYSLLLLMEQVRNSWKRGTFVSIYIICGLECGWATR